MKKLPPIVTYSVLRLLAFLVPFGILMLFPLFRAEYWLAAIFAALIGVSLSIIFLRRPFDASNTPQKKRRVREDDETEDAVIDAAVEPATTQPHTVDTDAGGAPTH